MISNIAWSIAAEAFGPGAARNAFAENVQKMLENAGVSAALRIPAAPAPDAQAGLHERLYKAAADLDEAIGALDKQTYEDHRAVDWDMPDDAELVDLTLTAKQQRSIGKAYHSLMAAAEEIERLRRPSPGDAEREAWQYHGEYLKQGDPDWVAEATEPIDFMGVVTGVALHTARGKLKAKAGDWFVRIGGKVFLWTPEEYALLRTPEPAGPLSEAAVKHMVDRFLGWSNLLDARQAEAMVRHMIDGLPAQPAGPAPGWPTEPTQAMYDAAAEALFSDVYGGSSGLDDMLAAVCMSNAKLAVDAVWTAAPTPPAKEGDQ